MVFERHVVVFARCSADFKSLGKGLTFARGQTKLTQRRQTNWEIAMSGPGKVWVMEDAPDFVAALLYDFDVGKSKLKSAHVNWIMEKLSVFARNANFVIGTTGFASRTDTDENNLHLSKERGLAVLRQAAFHNPGRIRGIENIHLGELAAKLAGDKDGKENERFRAVMVAAGRQDKVEKYVQPAPTYVERRTYVLVQLHDKISNEGYKDGNSGYQAGQALRRGWGLTTGVLREKTSNVDERFLLTRVTLVRSNTSDGIPGVSTYDQQLLEVYYDWGPWTAAKLENHRVKLIRKAWADVPTEKDLAREIDWSEGMRWVRKPLWMYDRL